MPTANTARTLPPAISHDGYIRLSLRHLDELPFIHLDSAFDPEILEELQARTIPACHAGYSEWISNTDPAISIGWSWFVHADSRRILPAPEAVRSNVMLVDARGYDLGPAETSMMFATWIATREWTPAVQDVLDSTHEH